MTVTRVTKLGKKFVYRHYFCPFKPIDCDDMVESPVIRPRCKNSCVCSLLDRIEKMKRKIKRLEAAKCKKSRKKRP